MTTDIEIIVEHDLFAPNSIIRLPITIRQIITLAGIEFLGKAQAGEPRVAVRRRCLTFALRRFHIACPRMMLWLFACHSRWLPKTEKISYQRLWMSLEATNIVLPSGERTPEEQIESPEGVRFFGAVRVPLEELDRAYDVLDSEPSSFILASMAGQVPSVDHPLLQVWQDYRPEIVVELARIATIACRDGNLLFRPFGFFDDVEVGVDVLLDPEYLPLWAP